MKRFEYQITRYEKWDTPTHLLFNKMGKLGWQLAGVCEVTSEEFSTEIRYYFIREINQ